MSLMVRQSRMMVSTATATQDQAAIIPEEPCSGSLRVRLKETPTDLRPGTRASARAAFLPK